MIKFVTILYLVLLGILLYFNLNKGSNNLIFILSIRSFLFFLNLMKLVIILYLIYIFILFVFYSFLIFYEDRNYIIFCILFISFGIVILFEIILKSVIIINFFFINSIKVSYYFIFQRSFGILFFL